MNHPPSLRVGHSTGSFSAAWVVVALLCTVVMGQEPALSAPVRLESGVSGHIHPALCRSTKGTLVATFCKKEFMPHLITRSTDGGRTWSPPTLFPPTDKIAIYPGSLTTLSDGRLLHCWSVWFAPEEKLKSRYIAYSLSSDDGLTWSVPVNLAKNAAPKIHSVIRHPIVELSPTAWLLPLADRTVLYNPQTGKGPPLATERATAWCPSCIPMRGR